MKGDMGQNVKRWRIELWQEAVQQAADGASSAAVLLPEGGGGGGRILQQLRPYKIGP